MYNAILNADFRNLQKKRSISKIATKILRQCKGTDATSQRARSATIRTRTKRILLLEEDTVHFLVRYPFAIDRDL